MPLQPLQFQTCRLLLLLHLSRLFLVFFLLLLHRGHDSIHHIICLFTKDRARVGLGWRWGRKLDAGLRQRVNLQRGRCCRCSSSPVNIQRIDPGLASSAWRSWSRAHPRRRSGWEGQTCRGPALRTEPSTQVHVGGRRLQVWSKAGLTAAARGTSQVEHTHRAKVVCLGIWASDAGLGRSSPSAGNRSNAALIEHTLCVCVDPKELSFSQRILIDPFRPLRLLRRVGFRLPVASTVGGCFSSIDVTTTHFFLPPTLRPKKDTILADSDYCLD